MMKNNLVKFDVKMTDYWFGKTFQFVSKDLAQKTRTATATSHQQREAWSTKKGAKSCSKLKIGS